MANPLYGSNKQDNLLDAIASAVENMATANDGDTNSAGKDDSVASKVLPITISGTTYYIALYSANTSS